LGSCRYLQGRYRESLDISEAANGKNPSSWGSYQIALARIRLGDPEAALQTIEQAFRDAPRSRDVLFYSLSGLIAALQGKASAAREQIELTVRNKKSFGHYHHAQYDIACTYALLGEKDRALDWLADAARNGFPCHSFFERDPFLESIRGEDRFLRLMNELKAECDGYRRLYRDLQSSAGSDSSLLPAG
jgi:tetratricopeptide (TPR) repeat protein